MRILRRHRRDPGEIGPDDVLWGVLRKEAHSDTDDPLAHEGLVQHAFLFGNDDEALCGVKPPRRLSRADKAPRPQLALAGPSNPRCSRCEAVLVESIVKSGQPASQTPVPAPPPDEHSAEEPRAEAASGSARHRPSSTPRTPAWTPRSANEANKQARSDIGGREATGARGADKHRAPRPRTRVRRGGRITVPAGRQSVLTRLPDSARGAAIAAEIDGDAGEVRVQSVALRDDGKLRISLNRRTSEAVDVLWFVVSSQRQ